MEDVAVESHRLFPTMFSWRKYPDQINLILVANAMSDAKRRRNGGLVSGGQGEGWRLTAAGQKFAQELAENPLEPSAERPASVPEFRGVEGKRVKQELSRILKSDAFAEWQETGAVSDSGRNSLLKINAYTSDELLEIKKTRIARCRGIDHEVDAFLNFVLGE